MDPVAPTESPLLQLYNPVCLHLQIPSCTWHSVHSCCLHCALYTTNVAHKSRSCSYRITGPDNRGVNR